MGVAYGNSGASAPLTVEPEYGQDWTFRGAYETLWSIYVVLPDMG